MTRLLSLAMLIGLAVGGTALYDKFYRSDSGQNPFRVEKVTRGDLQINVRATGTVEPEETVDVGAQVVGRIKELGKDPRGKNEKNFTAKPVDYEMPVTKEAAPPGTDTATTNKPASPDEKADATVQYQKKKLGPDSIGKKRGAPAVKCWTLR